MARPTKYKTGTDKLYRDAQRESLYLVASATLVILGIVAVVTVVVTK